jgi:hypothetical protein
MCADLLLERWPTHAICRALFLTLCLTTSTAMAAGEFTTDKPSPLKLARPIRNEDTVVRFSGTVRIAGRFVAAWEGLDRKLRHLRITFRPDSTTAGLLPHPTGVHVCLLLLVSVFRKPGRRRGLGRCSRPALCQYSRPTRRDYPWRRLKMFFGLLGSCQASFLERFAVEKRF